MMISKLRARCGESLCALLLSCILLTPLAAGAIDATGSDAEKPLVLASVPPQAFFIDRIAGEFVRSEAVIPPTADHGIFEPNMSQLSRYSKAIAYFKVGHPDFTFEKVWVSRISEVNRGMRIFDCSEDIQLLPADPHVWVSISAAAEMVANIAEGLTALFPARESEIDRNSQQLIAEIVALGKSIREQIGANSSRSHFISAHPYWGYFARELNLTQISIEEEGKEPNPARIAEIIEIAKKHRIKALLVQPQYSDQSARTIAREIDGRLLEVDPFAYDWLESMRRAGTVFHEALGG